MTEPARQITLEEAYNLATEHHLAGRLQQAEAIYRQILVAQPNHPDVLHRLGILASQVDRPDVALELIGRAIAVKPQFPQAYLDLGNALKNLNRTDQAIAAYRHAIALQSDFAAAYVNLGHALLSQGKSAEAEQAQRKAIEFGSDLPEAHSALGHALLAQGRAEEAAAAYQKAIELRPNFSEARNNLGVALQQLGLLDESARTLRAGLELDEDPRLHFNLGITYLLQGKLREGWPEYDCRWRVAEYASPSQQFPQPQWNGEELNGQRILLHAEQGFGDTIQFARYIPMVAQRGGRVILKCPPELTRLLQRIQGVDQVVSQGSLPPFDVHCRLLSLPRIFDTSLETIPATVPYLSADPEQVRNWRERLKSDSARCLKVGLSWTGSSRHRLDLHRSIPLEKLQALTDVKDVRFFSLQKDGPTEQSRRAGIPSDFPLIDWTNDFHDFADSAALIENLDLVITVDTAAAHLAGALGKPVWVLLPFAPDWRWMRDRADSPWYPTLRLFRQSRFSDWQSPIEQIVQALRSFKMTEP